MFCATPTRACELFDAQIIINSEASDSMDLDAMEDDDASDEEEHVEQSDSVQLVLNRQMRQELKLDLFLNLSLIRRRIPRRESPIATELLAS